MEFLRHIFSKHKSAALSLLVILVLVIVYIASNTRAQTGPFLPGDELDPGCGPLDVNCKILSSGWQDDGTNVRLITGTDKVGIGTTNPTFSLEVMTGAENYGISHTDGEVTLATYIGDTAAATKGGWIGTLSGNPLVFYTGNTERALISAAGNFGIGTSSPTTKLHVLGNTKLEGNVEITGTCTGCGGGGSPAGNSGNVQFNNGGAFAGSDNLFWDFTGNRLGIGTTSPQKLLHVSGNVGSGIEIGLQNSSNNISAWSGLTLINDTGEVGALWTGSSAWPTSELASAMVLESYNDKGIVLMADGSASSIIFETGGSGERMRIDSAGNVGIGTSTPARTLHISDVMRLEPRATAPSSPSAGDIYFDSNGGSDGGPILCTYQSDGSSSLAWRSNAPGGTCS